MFDSVGKEQQWLILGLIVTILVGSGVVVYKRFFEENSSSAIQIEEPAEFSKAQANKIVIHISGAVKKSGVYSLGQEDRVIDAINLAGGAVPGADLNSLNLASQLADGQKIVVPYINKNDKITFSPQDKINHVPELQCRVNINSANEAELVKIKGIGPSTAKKIIEYREKNGNFRNIEEIKEVGGIGPKKFEKIKDYITIY